LDGSPIVDPYFRPQWLSNFSNIRAHFGIRSGAAKTWNEIMRCLRSWLQCVSRAIAAMDFFTVPTITFGVLYCFFVISHDRRRILHVNVTKHPTSSWIIQQLREAFPFEASHKYLIFDRDQKFGFEVIAALKATRILPKQTSFRSPWQNGIAERWVGSAEETSWTTSLH
jgi:hypothetical protein